MYTLKLFQALTLSKVLHTRLQSFSLDIRHDFPYSFFLTVYVSIYPLVHWCHHRRRLVTYGMVLLQVLSEVPWQLHNLDLLLQSLEH